MKRPSPLAVVALVVALFALVASLGGVSYAGKLITGKDVKNGSLTGADVKNGSIKSADLAPGTAPRMATVRIPAATGGATYDAARAAAPAKVLYTAGTLSVYAKCFVDPGGPATYAEVYIKTKKDRAIFDSDSDDAAGPDADDYLNKNTDEVDREVISTSAGPDSSDFYGNHSTDFHAVGPDRVAISGLISVGAKHGTIEGGNGPWGAGDACLVTTNLIHD
ncbi:MAG: hypothetical protein WBP61_11015 [Nocardioides sp.]